MIFEPNYLLDIASLENENGILRKKGKFKEQVIDRLTMESRLRDEMIEKLRMELRLC
jgi:hypothetical protein